MTGPCTSGFWKWMALVLIATTATVTGQGCPIANYAPFNGGCYKDFPELKTYDQARQTCAADGGLLAMPKNSAINTFIHQLAGGGRRWIGMTDVDNEGQWVFADGETLTSSGYTNWHPNEPNNEHGYEHCAEVLGSTHGWNDAPCSFSRGFICQLAIVCQDPLGMESGTIPDDSITAIQSGHTAQQPHYGRLNGTVGWGGWGPQLQLIGVWLQVDLGVIKRVTGTIIQGGLLPVYIYDSWVTSYKLEYSGDETFWTTYADSDGSDKVFTGNTDTTTPVTNLLDNPVAARYVRFYPQTWNNRIAMRVEILGCDTELLWGLTLNDAGMSHLNVSWTVVGNLPISRYTLSYQPTDGSGSYQDLSPAPGADTTLETVRGLQAHMEYTLTLTSFDEDDQPNGVINGTFTTVCQEPFGMESGAIPDESITASEFGHNAQQPHLGRLKETAGWGGWGPHHQIIGVWLQVDLGVIKRVTGTITQGGLLSSVHIHDTWVTSYKLEYSGDEIFWTTYADSDGSDKVFPGNTDSRTPVTNILDNPVDARYVRFYPQTWHNRIAMRVEILGCDNELCPIAGFVRFNGVCYKAFAEMKNYTEAEQTCDADGGLLAMPKDDAINTFIHNLAGDERSWIGLNDIDSEGQWVFADGQTLASTGYTNRATGEPNHFYPDENCAELLDSAQWNDDPCDRNKGFICQIDTDGDAETAFACENSILQLSCSDGKTLFIEDATFGRTSTSHSCPCYTCSTDCRARNSLGVVRAACQGNQQCTVEASDGVFGDPCYGVQKYLEVSYRCIEETAFACENSILQLSCSDGKTLFIEDATFGRTSTSHSCPCYTCSTDCRADNSLAVVKAACQGNQQCTVEASDGVFGDPCYGVQKYLEVSYRCIAACTQNATCMAHGDPHYVTFDGTTYNFQGPCRYTFAKDCGSTNDFNIEVQQVPEPRNPTVSLVNEVYVMAYGYEIGMLQRKVVTVKGPTSMNAVTKTPTFTIENGKINVTPSGTFVRVELTELCVVILFGGTYGNTVEVKIPSSYQNRMCGLCGNYNSMGAEDLVLPNGNIASNVNEFGNSWEIDNNTCPAGTRRRKRQTQEDCDSNYSDPCNVLTDTNGPFAACHGVVDPQWHLQTCVFDECATQSQGGFLCANLGAYYHSCIGRGVSPFTWRTPDLCPLECPANSTYTSCATACPATCANPSAPDNCKYPCLEGCECDAGYVLSGLDCVPEANCGCMDDNGYYHPLGGVWVDGGEECVCNEGGTVVCTVLSGLTLDDAGISHLTVSWTVLGSLPISRYRLRYQRAGGSYQDLSPAPGAGATSATVSGLLADTEYTLTLTALDEDDQPNGLISGTYTTDSVVVNVECDQDSMRLSIPRAALLAVNVEDLHLLDPDCGATEDEVEDAFKLETHLQECGTRQETSGDDKLIFSNEVIANQVTYDNGAVRNQPVNLPFQCEFLRQHVVSQGGDILYNIPSPRVQIVDANNSFIIEMRMYTSGDFSASYESSDFPIQVLPSDRLNFGLSVASPLDNLELFARDCVSTPTTNPDDSPSVSIIDNGCQVDQTLQKDNDLSNDKALYYSVAAFTFPNAIDPSLVYFHCTMIICFKDDPDSRCKQGCIPPAGRRRRAVSDGTESRLRRESSRDKQADITQGPFQVLFEEESGTESAGVPLGTAVGASVGVAGVMVLLIVVVVLVKKRGGLALGRKKRDDDTVGLDNYAFQTWGKMSKTGIADTKA